MAEWPMLILTTKIQDHVWREQSPVWVIFFLNNDKTTRMPLPWLGKVSVYNAIKCNFDELQAGSERGTPAIGIGPATTFKNNL